MTAAGSALAACAPEVIKETVTVKETVIVEGTPQVKEVEKVVTVTPPPAADAVVNQMSFPLTGSDVEMFRSMQDAFMEQNPGIDVNVQIEPWKGRDAKMLAYIAAGNPPNCVYFNPDFYPKFLAADGLEPMDGYLEPGFRDDFNSGPLEAVTYDGKTYGLPILTSAYVQLYNKRLADEAGIAELPTTYEGMRGAAEKVHALGDDVWGARLDLGPEKRSSPVTWFIPLLWAWGGEVYNEDGTAVAFDGPEGEGALNYLADYYRDGLVQPAALTGGGLMFSSDQIGFYIQVQNNYAVDEAQANPDMEIGVVPTLENVNKVNFGTVGSYCMLKPNENFDATAKWISFVTSPENTVTILKASGFISPRKSIAPEAYAEGVIVDVAKEAPYMRPEPKHVKAREVLNALNPELEAVFTGEKTAREALDAGAAACNAIIAAG